jgi:hypothetical protein
MNTTRRNANFIVLAGMAAAALLYRFPPERYSFYPACPVYRYLHLYCPGCGSTRALAALLHGRIMEAMHYNPFFVALVPVLLLFAMVAYWQAVVRNEIEWPQIPVPALTFFLGLVAVFTIARNL